MQGNRCGSFQEDFPGSADDEQPMNLIKRLNLNVTLRGIGTSNV